MRFNRHSELRDTHAFLSASSYHWLNYSDEKLIDRFHNNEAARKGVRLHAFAHEAIELGIKQRETGQTINMYINDAIGYGMKTEQVLVYSINCFGTADSISFRDRILRIFDYKSGLVPASLKQNKVYAALFCLEYKVKPTDIDFDLRIYQNDDIIVEEDGTDPLEIMAIMAKIIDFDKIIEAEKAAMYPE